MACQLCAPPQTIGQRRRKWSGWYPSDSYRRTRSSAAITATILLTRGTSVWHFQEAPSAASMPIRIQFEGKLTNIFFYFGDDKENWTPSGNGSTWQRTILICFQLLSRIRFWYIFFPLSLFSLPYVIIFKGDGSDGKVAFRGFGLLRFSIRGERWKQLLSIRLAPCFLIWQLHGNKGARILRIDQKQSLVIGNNQYITSKDQNRLIDRFLFHLRVFFGGE